MIPDEKFGKQERILRPADFRAVYKNGRSSRKNSLVLCYLPNKTGHSRIGFSISSKNVKRAVGRNRIRRALREIYRRNKGAFKQGVDMVVVVKKEFGKNDSYKTIEHIFLELAKGAGILR